MTAPLTDRQVTAEELLRLPDDGFRYELVRGELRKMTPAGFHHGAVIMNVSGPPEREGGIVGSGERLRDQRIDRAHPQQRLTASA